MIDVNKNECGQNAPQMSLAAKKAEEIYSKTARAQLIRALSLKLDNTDKLDKDKAINNLAKVLDWWFRGGDALYKQYGTKIPREDLVKVMDNECRLFYDDFAEGAKVSYELGAFFSESDEASLFGFCEDMFGFKTTKDNLYLAINLASRKRVDNNVMKYLRGLPDWDGVKRAERVFIDILGAEDTALTRSKTVKFLVGALKRVMIKEKTGKYNCKFDNMIVLTGTQGLGKSVMCQELSAGMYTNVYMDEDAKDRGMKVSQTWFCIFDEMRGFNRKEAARVKEFITLANDSYRPPYGRTTVICPRHCVFIGSANDVSFLKDESSTYERRFWILECNKENQRNDWFDIITDKNYVKQIWAEVLALYKSNPKMQLTLTEDERVQEQQMQMAYKEDSTIITAVLEAMNLKYYRYSDGYCPAQFVIDRLKRGEDFIPSTVKDSEHGVCSLGEVDLWSKNMVDAIRSAYGLRDNTSVRNLCEYSRGEWEYKLKKINKKTMRVAVRVGSKFDEGDVEGVKTNTLDKVQSVASEVQKVQEVREVKAKPFNIDEIGVPHAGAANFNKVVNGLFEFSPDARSGASVASGANVFCKNVQKEVQKEVKNTPVYTQEDDDWMLSNFDCGYIREHEKAKKEVKNTQLEPQIEVQKTPEQLPAGLRLDVDWREIRDHVASL